jgi:hypothetical protein
MLMFSLLVLLYSFKESLLLHLHICNCNAYLLLQDKKNKSAVGVNLTHFAQSIWMLKNCPKGWCPFYLEDFSFGAPSFYLCGCAIGAREGKS